MPKKSASSAISSHLHAVSNEGMVPCVSLMNKQRFNEGRSQVFEKQ
jgi:hypothetical protein